MRSQRHGGERSRHNGFDDANIAGRRRSGFEAPERHRREIDADYPEGLEEIEEGYDALSIDDGDEDKQEDDVDGDDTFER